MALSRLRHNCVIGRTDSYKVTHWLQYNELMTQMHSYYESRGGEFEETIFYGLYYYLAEYFSQPITLEDIEYWAERWGKHFFGATELFNREGWELMLDEYDGRLPIRVRAVPEGTVVPTRNVLMTIEATDDRFAWAVNYAETMLGMLWYPCTVATLSREALKIITKYAKITGADLGGVVYKLHDFGFRGSTSFESAAIGGSAHLINFRGTDTAPGFEFAEAYYGEDMAGNSIPASEHSVMTSEGRDNEVDVTRRLIDVFSNAPTGLFALVGDSYDIFQFGDEILGQMLYEKIVEMPNLLVVRPDSGNIVEVVLKLLGILGHRFGFEVNEAGYKVLNHVRVIQGDGMDLHMIGEVCAAMERNGWSIDNIAFGMGAGLLQKVNRDTSKYAFKASAVVIDGEEIEVWKDPITDPGKSSKRGRLALVRTDDGGFRTQNWYETEEEDDVLELVFENGVYVADPPKFSEIRERARLTG